MMLLLLLLLLMEQAWSYAIELITQSLDLKLYINTDNADQNQVKGSSGW